MSTESESPQDAATEAAQHVGDGVTAWDYAADEERIADHLTNGLAQAGVEVSAHEQDRLVDQIGGAKDETNGATRSGAKRSALLNRWRDRHDPAYSPRPATSRGHGGGTAVSGRPHPDVVEGVALPSGALDARQLSDVTGVGSYVLELWRQRFGFPSADGLPLSYGPADVATVMRIVRIANRRHGGDMIAAGAQVLTKRLERPTPQPRLPLSALRGRFVRALTLLDERRANGLLELAFRDHPEEAVINRVVTPAGWTMASQMLQSQPERIGAYLFANVTRQVLNRRAARYPVVSGPALWLACPRGEVHDVGLHAVRLMLAKDGWSTRLLGQNTDVVTLRRAARRLEPAAVLLTVSRSVVLHRQVTPLAALAREVPTFLGGPGVTRADGEATGATVLITPVDRVGALIRDHLSCNASLATPQPP